MPLEGIHQDRGRAESFGPAAQAYDRFRSGYPDALIDDLLAARPSSTLDVGCGTGKVAAAIASRGFRVVGVEPDDRMAAVARSHGLEVDVASFESWDSQGQTFDLVTCGHAWQWIDPLVGGPKAASLLRPGGTIALFWNYHVLDDSVLTRFRAAYRVHAPGLAVVGQDPSGLEDADPFRDVPSLTPGETRTYRWVREFDGADWTGMVGTFSDHQRLGPDRLAALQRDLWRIIDEHDGLVVARGGTYVWSARTLPT
ncbi:methyltransferase domain-containing protein [Terrabacter sp. LjRoot27]|uniref:class I SAM-dependent methyltransferase n=1 Tax=Terrabacter sp. LjRoot27 TaxID=3342306 RepID=UPI003ED0B792